MPYPRQYTVVNTQVSWNDEVYAERMSDSIAWIQSLGIKIPARGRHQQYLKNLKRCAEKGLSSDLGRPSPSRDSTLLTARYETHEIDRITRHFRTNPPINVQRKLKEIVVGPYNFYDERSGHGASSMARNTTSELFAGAHFTKHKIDVEYGDDSYPEPMLKLSSGNIAVQCKRLSSASSKAALRNISTAIRQIETNVEKGDSCDAGFVFLDISKLVCPTGFVVVGSENNPHQNNAGRERMKDFMYRYVLPLNLEDHPLVDGIMIRASFFFNDPHDEFRIDTYVNQIMGKHSSGGSTILSVIGKSGDIITNVADGYEASARTTLVAD